MNNLSFSKNVFGGQGYPNSVNIPNHNSDGGRRSLEEVRESQLEANRKIHPDAGKEFQVQINNHQNFNASKMTGAFITRKEIANEREEINISYNDAQNDLRNRRIEALNNLNRRNF